MRETENLSQVKKKSPENFAGAYEKLGYPCEKLVYPREHFATPR